MSQENIHKLLRYTADLKDQSIKYLDKAVQEGGDKMIAILLADLRKS